MLTRQLLVAAAAALVVLATATTGRSGALPPPVVFTDAAGDSGAAPDVTEVAVSNNGAEYTFRFSLGGAGYPAAGRLYVLIDADKNPATGSPVWHGADYYVAFDAAGPWGMGTWTGDAWQVGSLRPGDGFRLTSDRRTLSLDLNASAISSSNAFDFSIETDLGDGTATQADYAPARGTWSYVNQRPTTLSFATSSSVVDTARRMWTITAPVVRSDTGDYIAVAAVTCSGKAGSARLPVIFRQIASQGAGKPPVALCAFQLPKKHSKLTASMTVVADGLGVAKSFSARS